MFIISVLGFMSHSRFKKVLINIRESNNSRSITHRIRYFQELNLILAIVLLDSSLSFIILSADGLTGRKYLNAHKFTADFMICNINITTLIVWFIVVLIFHPKPLENGTGPSMQQSPHNFLSAPKPLDGFSGTSVPVALTTQPSQSSSDYLYCTESMITVPVEYTENDNNTNMTYNINRVPQSGQSQNPPNTDGDELLSPSSTRSTATFVSHQLSGCRNSKEINIFSSPPHVSVNLINDQTRQEEMDWNESQITVITSDNKDNSNNRRPNSNDTMWLQQSLQGGDH
ncbi:hypothetical protein INT45_006447 [Circinella minor]|uniref:Uncharacterized protein n=1 Tax=Circinella minor TaxID=1195481 RepID=A0A8H7SEC9_9FUNG|nr:hypothetical protein INT45_006447 [Circinella minor]